jgi:tripartite ATP-independent transporter DctM subunit
VLLSPLRIMNSVVLLAEHAGAVLLIAEIVLLLSAVLFRYVLRAPLTWSDELAEIMILWQAMLGAVVAFHRGRHLSPTVVTRNASSGTRRSLEGMSKTLVGFTCLLLGYFACQRTLADSALVTPILSVSRAWGSSAMIVGFAMVAVLAFGWVGRLAIHDALVRRAVILVLCVIAALYLVRHALANLGDISLVIHFGIICGTCMLVGVPIAFSFCISALAYVLLATNASPTIVSMRMEDGMSHVLLLSVPLFIALGAILDVSGMAKRLIHFLAALVGRGPAGMSYVLIGAMMLVSGISGSKAADMAAISPILLPEMRKRGVRDAEIIALLSASSAISETIPPSLVLIMTGAVTGLSIGALFKVGWTPALLMIAVVCMMARLRAPAAPSVSPRAGMREIMRLGLAAAPVLVLPLLIRAAVTEGVATATEVATIGVIYVFVVSLLLYRKFEWMRFYNALKSASSLTGAVFLILAASNAMAWGFVQSGASMLITDFASSVPGGRYGFLVASVALFVALGSILEGIPAIVLLGPILFPAAVSFGVPELHYALIAVMSMGIGLFAPPFGVGFYTACAIAKVDPSNAMRSVWVYLCVLIAGVAVISFFPALTSEIGF